VKKNHRSSTIKLMAAPRESKLLADRAPLLPRAVEIRFAHSYSMPSVHDKYPQSVRFSRIRLL
jgi:hypothetical protein